jgi:hypothetical protein
VPTAGLRRRPRLGNTRHGVRADCVACLVTCFALSLTLVCFERRTHEALDFVGCVA